MSVERATVLIADDHAPTRADLREVLEADGRFAVCAEVADAAGAVEAALRERPDICLLDVNMPGRGVAAAWEIGARIPGAKIVMLTMSEEDGDLFAALRAGADGYLLKDIDPDRLAHALADVLRGEAAIPRRLVSRLMSDYRDRGARRRAPIDAVGGARLTSREWEILDLLRQGLSTAAIARDLVLSQATVRTHVAAVLRKLGASDRDEAIRIFEGR